MIEDVSGLQEYLEPIHKEDVYRILDRHDQCMGDITLFWDGQLDFTDCCKYVIMGVPEDKGVIEMGGPKGTYEGPHAFRKEFYSKCNYFKKQPGLLADIGNIRIDLDADVTSTHNKTAEVVSFLVSKDIYPIVIGGGSDTTYGAVKGLQSSGLYQKIGIVSFDAHLDLHDVPGRFFAGSTMKKILTDFPDFTSTRNLMYLGVRKETISPHTAEFVKENNITVFYKDTIGELKKDLLFALNTASNSTDGILISFDMDSCDAGMMPGTSFPMPGGFKPDEVIEIAKSLSKYKMSLYLDVVELNPRLDTNNITSVMAALLVFHFLEKK